MMFNRRNLLSRRRFVQGTSMGLAGAALTPTMLRGAAANDFPSQSMQILIPTGEGGGVDRTARMFNDVWSDLLGVGFEYGYFPGASGQVGYETYMGRRDPDCYNLLFGNIGPEMIMYATQEPGYSYPDDYYYFAGIDVDDAVIWVANDSPFQTLEDLIEEGQSRTITFSGSRLPHPSSIGVFAIGEETGADFNVIPYGGGNPARSAAITGEVDACCTFMTSSLGVEDQVRFLTVFQDRNRLPGRTNEARPVNEILGTEIPPLVGRRAFAIHRAAAETYPDRFALLNETLREAFESDAYRNALQEAGEPLEFVEFADEEACAQSAEDTLAMAERFRDLLTGE